MSDTSFFDRYEEPQKTKLIELVELFRTQISDYDASLNILNGKQQEFTDAIIFRFFERGLRDLNKGSPKTDYTIFNFPDEGLLVDSAVIFSLIAGGILQMRNQIDTSDAGLSVGLFRKTGLYQQWAAFLLQPYFQDKADFKRGLMARRPGAGFVGIGTEFGYRNGW